MNRIYIIAIYVSLASVACSGPSSVPPTAPTGGGAEMPSSKRSATSAPQETTGELPLAPLDMSSCKQFCLPHEFCVAGKCTLPSCQVDDDCPGTSLCEDGLCAKQISCTPSDFSVCVAPSACHQGECRDRDSCVFDRDCTEGQHCVHNICYPSDCGSHEAQVCGGLAACVDNLCRSNAGGCQRPEDCAEGEGCAGGFCLKNHCAGHGDCDQGRRCVRHTCVPTKRCKNHGECAVTDVCWLGHCRAATTCASGAGCPASASCTEGRCLPQGWVRCENSAQCSAPTPHCLRGRCVPDSQLPPPR